MNYDSSAHVTNDQKVAQTSQCQLNTNTTLHKKLANYKLALESHNFTHRSYCLQTPSLLHHSRTQA